MTVGELKKMLDEYTDETKVLVSGYEGGLESSIKISATQVVPEEISWCGDYERLTSIYKTIHRTTITAVLITPRYM